MSCVLRIGEREGKPRNFKTRHVHNGYITQMHLQNHPKKCSFEFPKMLRFVKNPFRNCFPCIFQPTLQTSFFKVTIFSTIFAIWHFLFDKEITHLNRDISSLTQFGDHSPSLSFIKTLQEVEFNFVATDQNNKI